MRRESRFLQEGPLVDACRRLKKSIQVTRQVAVSVNDRLVAPILIGVFRSTIVLPAAAMGWTEDQLEMVLLHELAHVRRWDNLVNLMQRVIESLLFFHPATWWLSRWVRIEREHCCDEVVVRHTQQPRAYAELLCQLASAIQTGRTAGMQTAAAMAQPPLMGRIRSILRFEEERMRVSRSVVGVSGLALVLILATVACHSQSVSNSEEVAEEGAPARLQEGSEANDLLPAGESHVEAATPESDGRFPTLGQEKAATRIWNAMGIELEMIDAKELKRVKKLGFDGALRVGDVNPYGGANTILFSRDLLVGLLSFPITDFQHVIDVLERPDLAELTPLKFYAIRSIPFDQRSTTDEHEDEVKTGRISVVLDLGGIDSSSRRGTGRRKGDGTSFRSQGKQ